MVSRERGTIFVLAPESVHSVRLDNKGECDWVNSFRVSFGQHFCFAGLKPDTSR